MNKINEMIAVTFAVIGQEASDIQIKMMASDLAHYSEEALAHALTRCRKELRGKMTLSDIIERIPGEHPPVEEAWSIVNQAIDNEGISLAMTQPMLTAYGAACRLSPDKISGRMAFKEVYLREVAEARARSQRPYWIPSLGTDEIGREDAKDRAEQLNISALKSLPLKSDKKQISHTEL